MEQAKDKAKQLVLQITDMDLNYFQDNGPLKIPAHLKDLVIEHVKPPFSLIKDKLDRAGFEAASEKDKEISAAVSQLGSRLNSDSNQVKVELQTLTNFLVEVNSEYKKNMVDLEVLKDSLKSIQKQAHTIRDMEFYTLVISSNAAMAEEIATKAVQMQDSIGKNNFKSELESLIDLVMDYSKSVKKICTKAEQSVEDLQGEQKKVTTSYQELNEELGIDWA